MLTAAAIITKFGTGERIEKTPGEKIIAAFPGDTLRLTYAQFEWKGPGGQTIWLCMGLKAGNRNFHDSAGNAQNLVGGPDHFASLAVLTIDSPAVFTPITLDHIAVDYAILDSTPPASYDTYIWLAKSKSSRIDQIIVIDDDAGILKVESAAGGEVRSLDVAYARVGG